MKKNVWILNHYASGMLYNKGGRHYWFAKYLEKEGYNPVIFSCNTKHGVAERYVDTDSLWTKQYAEEIGVPFIFVKSNRYTGNGIKRIFNMIGFYKNVKKVAKEYAREFGKPDIIYASSVHPLTLVAGIKLAKHFGVKCICEVRDLWPESLVAYGILSKKNLFTKLLYSLEKWIYKKSDHIIMTISDGYDYIIDRGWNKTISHEKVSYINNGVDLEQFVENSERFNIKDADLENHKFFKCIYTGSIRKVNNLSIILDAAKIILENGYHDVKFIIFGSGNEEEELRERVIKESITNVIFKGRVNKECIPYVLSKSDINILHNTSTTLDKYGQSQNKLFEYLASGKAVIQTYSHKNSIIDKFNCGICCNEQTPLDIANTIMQLKDNESLRKEYGMNALIASKSFNFEHLTNKLIDIIENKL